MHGAYGGRGGGGESGGGGTDGALRPSRRAQAASRRARATLMFVRRVSTMRGCRVARSRIWCGRLRLAHALSWRARENEYSSYRHLGTARRCGAVRSSITQALACLLLLLNRRRLQGCRAPQIDRSAPAVEGGRGGRRRSCDRNDRGVGLSSGARNTILDSRLDVRSCSRHATPTGGWIARGEALICTTDE